MSVTNNPDGLSGMPLALLTRRDFLRLSGVAALGASLDLQPNPFLVAFQKVTDTLTKYVSTQEISKQPDALKWFDGANISIISTPVIKFGFFNQWIGERGVESYEPQTYSAGGVEMTAVLAQKGTDTRIFLQDTAGRIIPSSIVKSGNDIVGINMDTGKVSLTVDEGTQAQMTNDGAIFKDLSAVKSAGKAVSNLSGILSIDAGKLVAKPHFDRAKEEYNVSDPMTIFRDMPSVTLSPQRGIYMSVLKSFGLSPLLPPIPPSIWSSSTEAPITTYDSAKKTVQAQDKQLKQIATATFDNSTKNWEWKEVEKEPPTFKELCDMRKLTFATAVDRKLLNGETYKEKVRSIANQLVIAYELDTREVFKKFTTENWKTVLTDWDAIKLSLDKGIVPPKIDAFCSWTAADDLLKFASDEEHGGKNKMKVRAQHLMWGADVPPSLVNAYKEINGKRELSKENIQILAEFMVKVRVAKYKGKIGEWDVADEIMQHKRYRNVAPQTAFWLDIVGDNVTDKVSGWTQTVDTDAAQCWIEDHLLQPDVFPEVYADLQAEMKRIKEAKLPIKKVGSENNFWWKNPPKKNLMIKVLNEIKAAGFEIASAETNVNIGPEDLVTDRRPAIVEPTDPLAAQATIYDDTLSAYIQTGGEAGVTQISDLDSWYNSYNTASARLTRAMMLDEKLTPKPAYITMYKRLKAT